jgi:hypothetical protein
MLPASLPPNTAAAIPAQPRPTDGKFAEARDDPAQAEELERQQDA